MNKNGFTLLELLASIVILSLILLIAVPGITNVSEVIRENQRENLIEKIEIAASKYAFDTGKTIIFVDELVREGYIESDKEDNTIEDPLTNKRMNCYVIEMEKTSDYYKATFKSEKNYDNNGVCDLNKLEEDDTEIIIDVSNSRGSIDNINAWINGSNNDITLKALSQSNILDIDCEVNKCVWTSSSGLNKTGTDTVSIDNVSNILNTKYTFQITLYDINTESVKRYTSSVNLKIDNESPTIYDNEIKVTNKFIYTDNKDVTIIADDGKGSGISGYYLDIDTGISCNSTTIEFKTSNKFTVNKKGTYKICVKDNVGNINSSSLLINYINETS